MIRWTEEQRELRTLAEELGAAAGEGHLERDAGREFGHAAWKLIRETGLLGLPFDERWGGLGQDLLTTMYVLEGLGYACRDGGFSFSVSTQIVSTGVPLQRFGSAQLKDRYLPRISDGSLIGAHAITEPSGGSDVMAMRTTAVRDGDDYVLNGSKAFVTNGPIADVIVVYALTGKRGSPAALTAFLVERDTPGLVVGPPVAKMGLATSPFSELFFDDCRVPAANVVGSPNAGFLVMDHVMKWEILCSFVINVGEMQHRLERSVEYARSRTQFGQKIGSFQSVSNRLADMHIAVESSRKWLYDTAQRYSNGENVTIDIAASKLITSENNVAVALAAVQLFGGYGYTSEYGLEKDLRDSVAGTIYSGTSDIQRQRIARMLGL
ncbi:acyl-CoA dehydrogenase family protein [Micromonospora eburnea]|uniref:L-prolyl-[peptidyl carrier protein] dehydrogenase n=1 Tax=Micromonospora eburnea TaxID=227316 RepID=A0A1C6VKI5_9ACTN|nr:acyl-CoA dehydrogenase family protein [Micromonospora eburnea]SCL66604.1 L-prolyl-[peptidyl carrier protein] dehydrogenase [Micromonospora eburnea]